MTEDTCCTIVPYFEVHNGKLDAFKDLCQKMVDQTKDEPKCLYYGFSFEGNTVHCREGYTDAEGLLDHLERIDPLLQEALQISDIIRLEVHGPEQELSRLRQPLAALNPQFFVLEYGFRK